MVLRVPSLGKKNLKKEPSGMFLGAKPLTFKGKRYDSVSLLYQFKNLNVILKSVAKYIEKFLFSEVS